MLLFVPVFLFLGFKPRLAWQTFEAWKYRNPEAVEPSDDYYVIGSLISFAIAGLFLVVGLLTLRAHVADAFAASRCQKVDAILGEDSFAKMKAAAARYPDFEVTRETVDPDAHPQALEALKAWDTAGVFFQGDQEFEFRVTHKGTQVGSYSASGRMSSGITCEGRPKQKDR